MQHLSIGDTEPRGLGMEFKLLPQFLKDLGYSTHMIGKWHLGFFRDEQKPLRRGFDTFYGIFNGAADFWTHFSRDPTMDLSGHALRSNEVPLLNETGRYLTSLFARQAERIIHSRPRTKPFFLYLAPTAVHCAGSNGTIQAPYEYLSSFSYLKDYDRQMLAGSLAELDKLVGKVVQALYDSGHLNTTIIAFSTDNGGAALGFSNNVSPNWPLRGSKGTVAEGGTRGPAFLWTPWLASRGRVAKQLFHITDWLPTLHRAAGGEVRDLPMFDGVEQWDSLTRGSPPPRKEILYNIDPVWDQYAIRGERFKVIEDRNNTLFNYYDWYEPRGAPQQDRGALNEQKKSCITAQVLSCFHGKTLETPREIPDAVLAEVMATAPVGGYCHPKFATCMYDLNDDPWERYNLYRPDHPEYMRLRARIEEFKQTMKPVTYTGSDPRADPMVHGGVWNAWHD
ncbi:arylsulfatase B-like isoform X2 [Ornithodoros turicata]